MTSVLSVSQVCAQDIVIQAVNGGTRQPIARNRLMVWAFEQVSDRGTQKMQQLDVYTDQNGTAVISSGTIKYSHLQVWVDFQHQCSSNPNSVSISVDDREQLRQDRSAC